MLKRIIFLLMLLAALSLVVACGGTPTPDTAATEQAAAEATEAAQPEDTPTPEPTDTPEPEPTDTPEPEPTDTPEPEPTDTPEPEPTDTPEPEPTDTPEAEPEALPLQDEPYVHPSGAFSFAIPQGWEVSSEDDTSVTVGSTETIANFSSMYMDVGREVTDAELEEVSEQMVDAFTGGTENYEVLAAEQDEEGLYVQVQFELVGVEVIADFLFKQEGNILYLVNFITPDYEAMQPTLIAMLDSYEVDADAVQATAPAAETEEPAPKPTPVPAEPPAPAGPAIPDGKGALIMLNCRGDVINVDIIPAGIFQELAPKTGEECQPGEPIFLDPGDYTLKASIAGVPSTGESAVTIVAGEGVTFTWY